MSFNLAEHVPALRYKSVPSSSDNTWGTAGNTCTVTDTKVGTNSLIVFKFNPSALPAGRWGYTCSQGSFVITSSESEADDLTFGYIIL